VRILTVMPAAPYPLRATGLSLRYLPILQRLGARHHVDLLLIGWGRISPAVRAGLEHHCQAVDELDLHDCGPASLPARAATRIRSMLPGAPPRAYTLSRGGRLRERLRSALDARRFDVMLWVTASYTPYLPEAYARRAVIDFIDSPALGVARGVFGHGSAAWLGWLERYSMLRWERELRSRFASTIYISSLDAGVIDAAAAAVDVVPNGVSANDYTPDAVPLESPNIGFVGNMDYGPNVEAVEWLHREVFVPLRASRPELTFYIVGRNPGPRVRRLADDPRIVVTGEVASAWEYLNALDVCTMPLLKGAGMKNKILEAMRAGRPVVTTSIGNEGIDAQSGQHLVVCRDAHDVRVSILELLSDPAARASMGQAARAFVQERFCWDASAERVESILKRVVGDGAGDGVEAVTAGTRRRASGDGA
jgi:glycosyltransferase involved in cell wall biosynthesis